MGNPGRSRSPELHLGPRAYLGVHVVVGLAICVLAVWLFAGVLDAVLDNATLVRWDVAMAAAVHARVTPPGLRVMHVITQLGGAGVVAPLAAGAAVLLWRSRRIIAVGWPAASAGGLLLDKVLKLAVHRTRPAYGAEFLSGHSYSFPSGHAISALICYGMLSYALTRRLGPAPAKRALIHAGAAVLVLAIGVSRIYLGVHYPSDVFGGWAVGTAWLAICLTGIEITERRAAGARTATG